MTLLQHSIARPASNFTSQVKKWLWISRKTLKIHKSLKNKYKHCLLWCRCCVYTAVATMIERSRSYCGDCSDIDGNIRGAWSRETGRDLFWGQVVIGRRWVGEWEWVGGSGKVLCSCVVSTCVSHLRIQACHTLLPWCQTPRSSTNRSRWSLSWNLPPDCSTGDFRAAKTW